MSRDPAARQPPTFALTTPDDADFRSLLPQIERYLLANFPGLRGLRQHRPHFDPARERTTDPIEHTLEVIAALDTRGLTEPERVILRAAAIFHDVGKLHDPLNVRHAVESAALCPPYLPDFGLDPAMCEDAIALVRNHDVLGRIAQGRLTPAAAIALLGTPARAELTIRLIRADIGSIRGLSGVLPSIDAAHAAVRRAYLAQERLAGAIARAEVALTDGEAIVISATLVALLEAIGATGTVTRAAAQLGLSARAARRRVAACERALGLALVVRAPTGSALTPEALTLIAGWQSFSADIAPLLTARLRRAFGERAPEHPDQP